MAIGSSQLILVIVLTVIVIAVVWPLKHYMSTRAQHQRALPESGT